MKFRRPRARDRKRLRANVSKMRAHWRKGAELDRLCDWLAKPAPSGINARVALPRAGTKLLAIATVVGADRKRPARSGVYSVTWMPRALAVKLAKRILLIVKKQR